MTRIPKFTRFSGRLAGMVAKPVWVCANLKCELHHRGDNVGGKITAPASCPRCGGLAFDRFQTVVEADKWAQLRLLEKGGIIKNLRKQVRFPLYACDKQGMRIEVAFYVADFVWEECSDGRTVIGDVKPKKGVDPLAALKLKWMAAQGQPVTILN